VALAKTADLMMEKGIKRKSDLLHTPSYLESAYEKIENSQLLELIVTDSIPLKRNQTK
jgi:ribose-phosphate pyrophosphokinase